MVLDISLFCFMDGSFSDVERYRKELAVLDECNECMFIMISKARLAIFVTISRVDFMAYDIMFQFYDSIIIDLRTKSKGRPV